MIVGTAGHIDHGKTTLVKALTGVDADRLPEEKRRGISIELGYAYMTTAQEQRIGFVDVPGHERLVHTMIAGATGIDFALLLVAADDGPMPQTREHLAVLSLLGLRDAAVVVTKIDRVERARVDEVGRDVAAMLQGTPLAAVPVLHASAVSGEGLAEVKRLLDAAAHRAARSERDSAAFRMAIDRAFTLDGVGTVVTGSVHAGSVEVGHTLQLAPGGATARVRSLHADNRVADSAGAGERCALALVGIDKEQLERGRWLVAPEAALTSDRIDAELTLWHTETQLLRSGQRVHVHLGAAACLGTVAVLDGDAIAPGARGRAQLVLSAPLGAWHGDAVVLRDASASRTLAGGRVLDPFGPVRYRRTPQRLAELDALSAPWAERPSALLAVAPHGLDAQRFESAQGRAVPWPDEAVRGGAWVLGAEQARQASNSLLTALAAFHERSPDELGPDAGRLRRLATPRLAEPLYRALLQRLQGASRVAVRGAFVHLPEHGVRLSATEQRIAQKVAPLLASVNFEGAWARDLARDAGESEALMRTTLSRLAQQGEMHQVVKDLFYPPATMSTLAALARRVAAQHAGEVTAAAFRDATQLGRKRAIQVLEYLDRVGLLRRVGDVHKLRADCALFVEEARAA
jgi:selenocysteine-specific elongation factor